MDRMRSVQRYLIIISLILLLFIAGCSGGDKECKKRADCPTKTCQILVGCEKGQCQYKIREDCCGNKQKDSTEDGKAGGDLNGPCTCPVDWGKCVDKGKKSQALSYSCNAKDECVGQVKTPDKISETDKPKLPDADLFVTYSWDNPFILGYSQFNIQYEIKEKDANVNNIKIKEVKIFQRNTGTTRTVSTVGQKDVDQTLWDDKSKIDENIIIDMHVDPLSSNETKETTTFEVETTYEYVKDTRGRQDTVSNSFKTSLRQRTDIVNPGISLASSCEICDDANSCTKDSCQNVGGFSYCAHDYLTNQVCCGNKVCDSGENICSCPGDCGVCNRDFGQYISYQCTQAQTCISVIRDREQIQKKTFTFENKNSYFLQEITINLNQPYNVRNDAIGINILLRHSTDKLVSVTILDFKLLDGDEVLGELSGLANQLQPDISFPFSFKTNFEMVRTNPEVNKKPTLRITYRYIIQEKDDQKTYTDNVELRFDSLSFINPEG